METLTRKGKKIISALWSLIATFGRLAVQGWLVCQLSSSVGSLTSFHNHKEKGFEMFNRFQSSYHFPCCFDLCLANLYLVPSKLPHMLQTWRRPVKCFASMCRFMSPILSSFPHSLQIRFLSFRFLCPGLVGRKFSLNSIMVAIFSSSCSIWSL